MKTINDYVKNINLQKEILLDVRRLDEYLLGHIEGAMWHANEDIASFNGDKKKRYLVYCRSGRRSESAVIYLKSIGYNAKNIGGILDYTGSLIKGDDIKSYPTLNKGEEIRLVAPSFGCVTEPYKTRLEYAIKNLREDGFKISVGPNVYLAKAKARSNTAKKCALEFNDAYLSSDAKAIISVGGGELMCEILPYIDFEQIKLAKPKIFMGFSDNANLTYTLTTICNIKTLYGVNAGAYYLKPYEYSERDSLNLMMKKINKLEAYPLWEKEKPLDDKINPLAKANLKEKIIIKNYPKGDIALNGLLLGGNLDILANLCGTKFDHTSEFIKKHKEEGIIWYLEACDLTNVGISRALFNLKEAGWFKYAKGFIFGRPLTYENKQFGLSYLSAIKNSLKELKVPLILDAPLGHYYPSLPMVNGAKVKILSKNNKLTIEYLDL